MEERWQRSRIRTYLRSVTGAAIDGTDGITVNQENAWMDDAYAEAWADCSWKTAILDERVAVGAQQRLINYPAGCAPGGVLEVAWWHNDSRCWIPLSPMEIPPEAHPDPIEDEGGDEWQDRCGTPAVWCQRAQIEISPATDVASEVKVRFRVLPSFADADATFTACDGLLVALKSVELLHRHMRESDLADVYAVRYAKRLSRLRAAFATGEPIPLAPGIGFEGVTRLPRYYQGESMRIVTDGTGD